MLDLGIMEIGQAAVVGADMVKEHAKLPRIVSNQGDGVAVFFELLKTGIRIFIGLIVVGAGGYFALGAAKLMRSSNNPQLFMEARNQMMYSVAGGVLAVGSIFFIGTGIDWFSGMIGFSAVDVGNVTQQSNPAVIEVVSQNGFLGSYNGGGVICSRRASNTNGQMLVTSPTGEVADIVWRFGKFNPGEQEFTAYAGEDSDGDVLGTGEYVACCRTGTGCPAE